MDSFSYVRAHSLQETVTLLNEPGVSSRVLAGGTDLMLEIRHGTVSPFDRLVEVTEVPELRAIEANGQITVGAAVTVTEIRESPLIQARVPFLAQACRHFGSVQIRNKATVGGNVANAAPCADLVPVLVCLDAEAVVVTPDGEKRWPVADFVTGSHRTRLPSGALIRAFVFDPPPEGSRTTFLRIGRRQATVTARVSLAALGACDTDGKIEQVRLAPGATFAPVRRKTEVEAMLVGQTPTEDLFAAAGQRMAQLLVEAGRRWSAPYKERALAALTERALREVVGKQDES